MARPVAAKIALMTLATPLRWMNVLETGVTRLDDWHRDLIEKCNDLLERAAARAEWHLIADDTQRLISDCADHFRFEEEIMHRTRFPRLQGHIATHRRIEVRLRGLAAEVSAADGSAAAHRSLITALAVDLIEIMVRHDLDYRSHLLHSQGRLAAF